MLVMRLMLFWAMVAMAESHHPQGVQMPSDGSIPAHGATTVRVLAWNVFDLPELVFPIASRARMERLLPALLQSDAVAVDEVDAVVLTELYNAADRRLVLAALADLGFVHHKELEHASMLDRWRMLGVVVVSRWPIERWASMPFVDACHGLDCLASKGCLHVRLHKATASGIQVVNLFAAHFYLGKQGREVAARQGQADAMRRFIAAQAAADDEITVVAGDFNAPWHLDGPDVLTTLGAYAARHRGPLDHTFVGEGHVLSGSPRRNATQRAQAARGAPPANLQVGRKWIDYVAAVAPGRAPETSELQVLEVLGTPYSLGDVDGTPLMTRALSDHHPVLGTFVFL